MPGNVGITGSEQHSVFLQTLEWADGCFRAEISLATDHEGPFSSERRGCKVDRLQFKLTAI